MCPHESFCVERWAAVSLQVDSKHILQIVGEEEHVGADGGDVFTLIFILWVGDGFILSLMVVFLGRVVDVEVDLLADGAICVASSNTAMVSRFVA